MTRAPQIVIAGVGNVLLGDDGFGVAVAHRCLARRWPDGVVVRDVGIRGFDLAFALAGADAAIVVDAVARGDAPGTLTVFAPAFADLGTGVAAVPDGHGMTPARVLAFLDERPPVVVVVGCEPATFGPDEGQLGLSAVVAAVIDDAVVLVERAVERIRAGVSAAAPGSDEAATRRGAPRDA